MKEERHDFPLKEKKSNAKEFKDYDLFLFFEIFITVVFLTPNQLNLLDSSRSSQFILIHANGQ